MRLSLETIRAQARAICFMRNMTGQKRMEMEHEREAGVD